MADGVVYYLHGVKHANERHFNLQPLITALRTYVENYNNWTEGQREQHWCTVVGLSQTLTPAHIRHHYCAPEEGFRDNSNFMKPKLTRSLEIYNWFLGKSLLWSEGLVGLGSYFGILGAGMTNWSCARAGSLAHLSALTALDETRAEMDLPMLIERLHTPIQNLEDDLGQGMKF